MRELDVAGISFSKYDWLPLQLLLLWEMLLKDELHSIMSLKFVDISLLGTFARASQMGASGDRGDLSSYHGRRDVLIYPRPGLTYRDFRSWMAGGNSIPRVLSQGSGSDESLDLILQMPTIVNVVANVVVESKKLGGIPLSLLVLQRLRLIPGKASRVC